MPNGPGDNQADTWFHLLRFSSLSLDNWNVTAMESGAETYTGFLGRKLRRRANTESVDQASGAGPIASARAASGFAGQLAAAASTWRRLSTYS